MEKTTRNMGSSYEVSGFRRGLDEAFSLRGYATCVGSCLPTF